MPELPDITVYVESLAAKVQGDTLNRLRLLDPFLLRTAVPPIASVEGRRVVGIERLGKRIVIALEGELFLVLHLLQGRDALAAADPDGIDVMTCAAADFAARLRVENHTLKRSLTNPKLFSGIGGAYADGILHRAKLSPVVLTRKLDDAQIATLPGLRRAGATHRLRQQ